MSVQYHIATQQAVDEYLADRWTPLVGFPITLCGKTRWKARCEWDFVWQVSDDFYLLKLIDCEACLLVYMTRPDLAGDERERHNTHRN